MTYTCMYIRVLCIKTATTSPYLWTTCDRTQDPGRIPLPWPRVSDLQEQLLGSAPRALPGRRHRRGQAGHAGGAAGDPGIPPAAAAEDGTPDLLGSVYCSGRWQEMRGNSSWRKAAWQGTWKRAEFLALNVVAPFLQCSCIHALV